ncbi:MAG: SatD family protein, partial [Ruminococcus sp.]|nr:SatD family protein [Ruminococcus sp.]
MIQSVTKAVNSVNADSAMLGKIIDSQQMSSAEKLLEMFKDLEEELNKVYEKDMWVKIENKPFYYCKEGSLYVVDPSRYQCANSGGFPNSVESVPTTYPNYNEFCNWLKKSPVWKHNNNG